MILLLGFAFLAGLVTILAPCMWPMLPIVLSSTVKGTDHKRPLGITLGVMASFAIFTLSISYLVRIFHFDPNILRIVTVAVITFLGLTLLIPALSRITEGLVSRLTGKLGSQRREGSDFKSGFLTGLTLGIIWSPCGGPILASIATFAATGMVSLQVILVTLVYVTGVGLPLFAFTYAGQRLITKTRFLSAYTGRVQQVFGVVMILTAMAIFFNYDKLLQLRLLEAFPTAGRGLNSFESSSEVRKQLDALKGKLSTDLPATGGLLNTNYPAPEFTGITKWLNTDQPLILKELKGKVVLVDFWTYTCINCIRTLPHVTSWYEKYKNQGFVVIGVHTPEFEFEKKSENVLNAIKQYKIHYPVAQDNDYATWNVYNNQYWPAEYLIDAKGNVRRTHFGEGKYEETEQAIQTLLKEAGQEVKSGLEKMADQTPQMRLSPETYLGSKRSLDPSILKGDWEIQPEFAVTGKKSSIELSFTASKVFLVLRPGASGGGKIKVFLDGKAVDANSMGQDVKDGTLTVDTDRLYTLIDLHDKVENHLLRLEFQTQGIEAFAFTFG